MPDSDAQFRSVLRGYDPVQVDQHLNELSHAASAVWQEAVERTAQVSELKTTNSRLTSELERQAQRARALEEAQEEAQTPTYTGLGTRIGSILTLVNKEAEELRTQAQADTANHYALADESALATRQDADDYARHTRSTTDDEAERILLDATHRAETLMDDARRHAETVTDKAIQDAESLQDDAERQAMSRQDADRQAMARREEAEAVYERARARTAAAAVDFETTLAARRDTAAVEFAAQVSAAEQQLAAVRLRSEQTRKNSEQAQQDSASKSAQQLAQAVAQAQTLVAEAKTKAERIRDSSERELAATTKRRDSINAQLNTVRHDLAALGGVSKFSSFRQAGPAQDEAAVMAQEAVTLGSQNGTATADDLATDEPQARKAQLT